ncbi:MAG: CbiX/SirB N-terminal domain-containing protein [Proteobacteria bacterium]|nr:CbiX/SirB N-terminal domain-containing protein [Pseudomonadota bacterium]
MSPSKPSGPGLLIVDHGSRNPDSNEQLEKLANSIAKARATWLVEYGHMELATPSFETAIDQLVSRGATEIMVHLHFLGDGYHVRETLPALIEGARKRFPEIPIHATDTLGQDPRIVEIIIDRMDAQSPPDRQSEKV